MLATITGDPVWDAVAVIGGSVVGGGGGLKIVAWLKRIISRLNSALELVERLDTFDKSIAALAKRQTEHEEADAVQAMIYLGFIEAGEEANFVQDSTGKTLFVSPALAKLMGLGIEEAQNGAWKDVIHEADREKALHDWDAFVRGALAQSSIRFRFQTPYGKVIPVLMKMVRKRIAIGGVIRIVGLVIRDDNAPNRQDTKTIAT